MLILCSTISFFNLFNKLSPFRINSKNIYWNSSKRNQTEQLWKQWNFNKVNIPHLYSHWTIKCLNGIQRPMLKFPSPQTHKLSAIWLANHSFIGMILRRRPQITIKDTCLHYLLGIKNHNGIQVAYVTHTLKIQMDFLVA